MVFCLEVFGLNFLNSFDISSSDWVWIVFCALCVGMSKTGVSGLGMLVVPILASVFGAKASTGILLPMLVMGDLFGVIYYHRHANLKLLLKLVPATVAGILVGVYVGQLVDDGQFKMIVALVVISGLILMILNEKKKTKELIPHNWFFASFAGLLSGFTTMIGNSAGPVMTIYFLSLNLRKNNFIGTFAWFFLLVNLFKVPFHVIQWQTIDSNTFMLNLTMLPVILMGAFIGVRIVKLIPEKPYRIFIIGTTALAAIKLAFF